jgi:hypothetical protein
MIKIWYRHHGQRPNKSQIIAEDSKKASILPPSFEVVGIEYGHRLDDGTVDSQQFALRVEPPSDSISTDAVDAIATAFENNWAGSIEHVETVTV